MEKQNGKGQELDARLEQLRGEVAEGLAQARRGELLDGRAVRERIRERGGNRRRNSAED